MQTELIEMFAVPLTVSTYEKSIFQELKFIENLDYKDNIQGLTRISKDFFILNRPELSDLKVNLSYGGFQSQGCLVDLESEFIKTLSKCHTSITNSEPDFFASAATTDARTFNLYGDTPATCYGPKARNIHGIDECVSINSVIKISQVIAVFIAEWCLFDKL